MFGSANTGLGMARLYINEERQGICSYSQVRKKKKITSHSPQDTEIFGSAKIGTQTGKNFHKQGEIQGTHSYS